MNNENNQNNNPQEINNNQPVNPQNVSMGSKEQQVPVEQVVAQPNMAMDSSINQVPVEANQEQKPKKSKMWIILLIVLIIGIIISVISPIGMVLVAGAFIASIVMIKKHIKLSKLVCILAVIYVVLYVAMIGSAAMKASKTIDVSRNASFASIAGGYINEVRMDMLSSDTKCDASSKEISISFSDIDYDAPAVFGKELDKSSSYVKVVPTIKEKDCTYSYYVYMTDGEHSVGTSDNPILETDLTGEIVTGGNN